MSSLANTRFAWPISAAFRPWRTLASAALAHYVSTRLFVLLWSNLGGTMPTPPETTVPSEWMALLASIALVVCLHPLAAGLSGSVRLRSVLLTLLAWMALGPCTAIEAKAFAELGGEAFIALQPLAAIPAVAWILCSAQPSRAIPPSPWTCWGAGRWGLRVLLGVLAFGAAYLLVGALILPLVQHAYAAGEQTLRMPAMSTLFAVILLRGTLFLAVVLSLIRLWPGHRTRLWLALGLALFASIGLYPLMRADFLPDLLRWVHGFEILADSFLHAGALVLLFAAARRTPPSSPSRPAS